MELDIIEFPGCFRIELICPKCGKRGFFFMSKKAKNNKLLTVYHSGGFSCRVEMKEIKELLNRHLP